MSAPRLIAALFPALIWSGIAGMVHAQTYPTKPIRIVTSSAAGGTDYVARMIAHGIGTAFNMAVVVDNRASGIIQGEIVMRAPPDGHTLLVSSGNMWIAAYLQTVPYDAVKDFSPITLAATSPYLLLVHPSVAAKSVKELVALAKASPGALNYASMAIGSTNHLAGELFNALAGVKVVRVGYKSSAVATGDVIGGRVQVLFTTVTSAAPHVKTGKLRALAVTGARTSALFPDLPTVAATVPGYQTEATYALFAPAKTPAAVISRLNQVVALHFKAPEVRDQLFNAGVEAVVNSPKEVADYMRSDMAKWGKLIGETGIRAE